MKILLVSDIVVPQLESAANLRRHYSDVEAIISCGDLPAAYLEFITSILNVPLLYVRGNHDIRYESKPPGGIDLHRSLFTYKGVAFIGLEGCINYNDDPVKYSEFQMSRMVLEMAARMSYRRWRYGRGVDVLVTHAPAFGIHDGKDLPHTGFKAFLRFMNWYRPRYMVHGHVHTWDRRKTTRTQYGETCVLNINPYTILEIEPR